MLISWRTYQNVHAIRVASSGHVWVKGSVVRIPVLREVEGEMQHLGVEDGWYWRHNGATITMGLDRLREKLRSGEYVALDKQGRVLTMEEIEQPNFTENG